MKKFMLTTAIVAVTSFGAAAQTTDTTAQQDETAQQNEMQQTQNGQMVPAFLVSDFTGKDLYTVDVEEARNLRDQSAAEGTTRADRNRMRWESGATFTASRDRWENVGSIDDVIMTGDGEIRGILIDVGGFLGIGARTVLVDTDQLYFVLDQENGDGWFSDTADNFFVVAAMTEEELESLPEFDEDQLRAGFETRDYDRQPGAMDDGAQPQQDAATMETDDQATDDQAMTDQPATGAAPADQQAADQQATDQQAAQEQQQDQMATRTEAPEGYATMGETDRTVDRLMGASVYGAENEEIGSVEDLVVGDDNAITHIVLDIGGFLGIGTHTVALSVDEVDILWHDQDEEVRIQVPMTQEELEQLPEHDDA